MSAIAEFLAYREKLAAREERVKAHVRKQGEKEVAVKDYARTAPDQAVVDREEALRARQSRELEMWRAWKASGMPPSGLGPLLQTFSPLINEKMKPYLGRVKLIPDAAIRAEFQLQFVQALRSYDPSKGSLGTYVYSYLDKAKRYIGEKQNVGRIPENRIYKIKKYQVARDELADKLGREPTIPELAEELSWNPAEVGRMQSELRSDLTSQGFEEDPFALIPSKAEEVLRLFKWELEGVERDVYEHLTGFGREHITSTGEVSKRLGIPDYVVSRVKNKLRDKIEKYL